MGSKDIKSYDIRKLKKEGPVPSRYYISFKTKDNWYYMYVSQQKNEPFSFKHKRRPDGSISADEITPQSIKKYFENNPKFELINEKLIYHGKYPD